jgi:hypothetical protein
MSSAREDLDQFHQFASARLANETVGISLDELYIEWHDSRSREDVNRAVRAGLSDIDAGRIEPAEQAMESIRRQFGFAQP